MPGMTSKGIVFPTVGDNLTPLEAVFATLASSTDTALGNYLATANIATAAEIVAGTANNKVVSPKGLSDAGVPVGDTGWVNIAGLVSTTSGFVKGSGFYCEVRKVGPLVYLRVGMILKAAGNPTLGLPVSGDVTNTNILTGIPAEYRPSRDGMALPAGPNGRANAYCVLANGNLQVTAMTPNANQTGSINVATNEQFSAAGVYMAT